MARYHKLTYIFIWSANVDKFFLKVVNVRFHENSASYSRIFSTRTDGMAERYEEIAFRFANSPRKKATWSVSIRHVGKMLQ